MQGMASRRNAKQRGKETSDRKTAGFFHFEQWIGPIGARISGKEPVEEVSDGLIALILFIKVS